MTESAAPSIARASVIVGLGNIASRILGLAREVVLANLFGSSRALEAFNNAVLVSRSIFDLLIAGHVSSAIVPVLGEIEATKGRDALWKVVSALAGMVILILSCVVLVMIAASGAIAGLIGGGARTIELAAQLVETTTASGAIAGFIGSSAQTIELTAQLIQMTAPALLLMCLFALYSGTLYALRIFTYPALGAAVFNGAMILVTVMFASGENGIYAVAGAWMAAALAQLALQLYGLRSGKLRISFNFYDALIAPVLRRIGWLYLPVMGSLIIDLATTRLLTYALAAQATIQHGNTYMQWATTLFQFPQGLVATAISAAVLPTLSRAAVLQDRREYDNTLGLGLRLTTVLILPAAAALAVLATPIIQLIYQHGQFSAYATEITANALRFYLIGLPFAAWDLLLVYAFYAKQDTVTPASIGIFSFAVYTAAALLLFPTFGLYALMLADATKHISHAIVSAIFLVRQNGRLAGQRLAATLLKTLGATLGMAAAAYLALQVIGLGSGDDTLRELVTVIISLAVCGISYAALAFVLRLEEFRVVLGIFARKLR